MSDEIEEEIDEYDDNIFDVEDDHSSNNTANNGQSNGQMNGPRGPPNNGQSNSQMNGPRGPPNNGQSNGQMNGPRGPPKWEQTGGDGFVFEHVEADDKVSFAFKLIINGEEYLEVSEENNNKTAYVSFSRNNSSEYFKINLDKTFFDDIKVDNNDNNGNNGNNSYTNDSNITQSNLKHETFNHTDVRKNEEMLYNIINSLPSDNSPFDKDYAFNPKMYGGAIDITDEHAMENLIKNTLSYLLFSMKFVRNRAALRTISTAEDAITKNTVLNTLKHHLFFDNTSTFLSNEFKQIMSDYNAYNIILDQNENNIRVDQAAYYVFKKISELNTEGELNPSNLTYNYPHLLKAISELDEWQKHIIREYKTKKQIELINSASKQLTNESGIVTFVRLRGNARYLNNTNKEFEEVIANNNQSLLLTFNKNQQFNFGPFTQVYPMVSSGTAYTNERIANSLKFKSEIIDKMINGEPVCIISYGPSGSGKTSTLIYLETKEKDPQREDGVLLYLANQMIEKKYNKCIITTHEIINKTDVKPVNKFVTALSFIPSDESGWVINNKDSANALYYNNQFKDIVIKILDERITFGTPNNLTSSRSHLILKIVFSKDENPDATLLLCDFAGVENDFDCNDNPTIETFKNLSSYQGHIDMISDDYELSLKGYREEEANKKNAPPVEMSVLVVKNCIKQLLFKELRKEISSATANSPYVKVKQDDYQLSAVAMKSIYDDSVFDSVLDSFFNKNFKGMDNESIKHKLTNDMNTLNTDKDSAQFIRKFSLENIVNIFDKIHNPNKLNIDPQEDGFKNKLALTSILNIKDNARFDNNLTPSDLKHNYSELKTKHADIKKFLKIDLDNMFTFIQSIIRGKLVKASDDLQTDFVMSTLLNFCTFRKGYNNINTTEWNAYINQFKTSNLYENTFRYLFRKHASKVSECIEIFNHVVDKMEKPAPTYPNYNEEFNKVCNERVSEGKFINDSITDMRKFISKTIAIKYGGKKSPDFMNDCVKYQCDYQFLKCFGKNEYDPEQISSNLNNAGIISKTILDLIGGKDNVKKLVICVFTVINLAGQAPNDPPLINKPYINISKLLSFKSQIDYYIALKALEPNKLSELLTKIKVECTKLIRHINNNDNIIQSTKHPIVTDLQKLIDNITTNTLIDRISISLTTVIDNIDKINSITIPGALEFTDSIAKFGLNKNICMVTNQNNPEIDFNDYKSNSVTTEKQHQNKIKMQDEIERKINNDINGEVADVTINPTEVTGKVPDEKKIKEFMDNFDAENIINTNAQIQITDQTDLDKIQTDKPVILFKNKTYLYIKNKKDRKNSRFLLVDYDSNHTPKLSQWKFW